MPKEMTICVRCAHHATPPVVNGAAPHVWYNHMCGNVIRTRDVIDPVTGASMYRDERGNRTDNPHPYCREINTCGHCEHYLAKK